VLGAIKRAVDDGTGAGRFLLTGSVRADLDAEMWPGTGRLVRVQMYGLTMREMVGELVSQIRPEVELGPSRPRLHHLRARDGGHEVDLLADMPMSNVLAIEIEAAAAPKASDARHLVWLRDQLGDRFLAGAVLHTGPRPFVPDERIFALPICALWE
jgi:hypothetical protein